ncbi:MAG: hypothetical protein FWE02_06775, partial [Defluviitaleaceae bacterium]|nr:hypothetical protein [Defluviitaleaceae bacterium]
TGKISITLQNIEEGKYKLYLDSVFIENIYSRNSKINAKIKTDHDINTFYTVIIRKDENIILEGVIKEKSEIIAVPSNPTEKKSKIITIPSKPIEAKPEIITISREAIIESPEIIPPLEQPIIENPESMSVPEQPIIENPQIVSIPEQSIIENPQIVSVPEQPIIENPKSCDINAFYTIIIKKGENVLLEGVFKEKPKIISAPEQPTIENLENIPVPEQPITENLESMPAPEQPTIENLENIPVPEQPITENLESMPVPEQPITENLESISVPEQPIIENLESMSVPEQPIIENKEKKELVISANRIDLFKVNPVIMPFKKQTKPYTWVSLNIHDLIYLPLEIWPHSRDKYILACYRKHKHLILGEYKGNYILGVPDIYARKNKLIMKKRGFMQFKSWDGSDIDEGIGGYWLMPVFILEL